MKITTAKTRLIANVESIIREKSKSLKVCDQMNVSHLYDVLDQIKALNEVQAHKLEKNICDKEDQSKKACAKFGWGWSPISPMDYMGFASE